MLEKKDPKFYNRKKDQNIDKETKDSCYSEAYKYEFVLPERRKKRATNKAKKEFEFLLMCC